MLISIDPGKFATKALSQSKRLYFPTRLSPKPTIDPASNTCHVTHENHSYLTCERAEQSDFDISKASLVHKLATYTAITQLLRFERGVQLVLGCPLNIYRNKELREDKNYILDNQKIHIDVNGISHCFYFEGILILPESAGVIYQYLPLFKGKRVAIVDLGGQSEY